MKLFNYIFIGLFLISAVLQYNDPDPYIWIPLYLSGVLICFQAIKGQYSKFLYLFFFLIYAGYAIFLFVAPNGVSSWVNEHHAENLVETMQATKPWIEQTREFGGLLILMIALIINWLISRKKITSNS